MNDNKGLADIAGITHLDLEADEYIQHPNFTRDAVGSLLLGMLMLAAFLGACWGIHGLELLALRCEPH